MARTPKSRIGNRFLIMHRQSSRSATLVGLICIGLWSSGFAVAHGASGGNGGAGHGAGHGGSHHRAGWHGERGPISSRIRRGGDGGWIVPGYGFYFLSIPSYCALVYWDGVPYYYADDVYYQWRPDVSQYVVAAPPAGADEPGAAPPATRCRACSTPAIRCGHSARRWPRPCSTAAIRSPFSRCRRSSTATTLPSCT